MYTLGIETSCDETSAAILKDLKVLSNVTISSLKQHKKYGGVVPEIATRAHQENIDKVVTESLKQAKIPLKKVDLISVTAQPGLIGALVVGLNFAKALSFALKRPFIGVNHLHAHLFASFLDNKTKFDFPFLGLVVSGGHTEIYRVDDFNRLKMLGATCDDACGEVYDKIARSFGLGYPGGPIIDELFDEICADEFLFKCGRRGYDLSFSGIKTALIYKKMELEKTKKVGPLLKKKLVSSFQKTVVDAIVQNVIDVARDEKINKVICGGGVIANRYLRQKLAQAQKAHKIKLFLAPREYTTDNAAIVAGLGFYLYNSKGLRSPFTIQARAN
jgi:N6-L-threonylcarbamoyladenine synthase